MLTFLDARRRAVLVLPELAPARAVSIPPPPLPDPRGLTVVDETFVVADLSGAGIARWSPAAASWTVSHANVFSEVTALAADGAGRILVVDASGASRIEPDGSSERIYGSLPGERCVGVAVAGDRRIAITLNPGRILVSEDDGATWQELGGAVRPGAITGLPTGFAVVDASARTVEVLQADHAQVTIGADDGLLGPIAVAPASDGVVISDAATNRVRRYVLADRVVPAEFVDGVTAPAWPPLFERVVALAAPMPTGAL